MTDEYDSGPYCKHWSDPADCEDCRTDRVLEEAISLLEEALPLIPKDAPLRWYKNDCLRDRIKKFIEENENA